MDQGGNLFHLLAWQFAGQLDQCVAAFAALTASAEALEGAITTPMLRRAKPRSGRRQSPRPAAAKDRRGGAPTREWRRRWSIAAKAVEDTAFYRHAVLLSRNDVGFDAGRISMST
jgi:(1->4)-alpha-D-glucan 1-alpha-D-glucosylmutase